MNPGPTPSNKHAPRGLPLLLFTAVLLPIVVVLIWFVSNRWSNASVIKRLEAKARKNGQPLTYAELAATYPPIPDNENGAALIMDAWEKDDPLPWRLFRDGAERIPDRNWKPEVFDPELPYMGSIHWRVDRTNEISSANLKAADIYLRDRKDHLDQVRKGLSHSKFWFPARIADGRGLPLPHLARLKYEALNFSIEALATSEHGDIDSAITAIMNTALLGNALASEPNEVSQFVRLACYHIAIDDMERLLSRRPLSIAQLNRLSEMLEELRTSGGLRLALITQRVSDLEMLDDLERGPVLNVIKPMQSDRRIVLAVSDHLLTLGDSDKPEILAQYDAIETKRTKAAAQTNTFFPNDLSWVLLRGMIAPAYKFARWETHRRAAITALAVERYRVDHQGKLPKQLSDIAPQYIKEIPSDTFDGKPLRLKQLPFGFVVGSSGIDNGDYKRPDPESTFTIER